jgi:mannose-6-phosphate isomerase
MWMGTHPGGPSCVEEGLTQRHKEHKGDLRELSEVAGGQLPFLFKLLAAEKPLSIQAHPNMAQAREGFSRESEAGLALEDPRRNYKDPCHKPEIICALVPLTVMAGFRKTKDILVSFLQLLAMKSGMNDEDLTQRRKDTKEKREREEEKKWFLEVINALEIGDLKGFFMSLFGLSEEGKKALNEKCLAATLGVEPGTVDMWDLTREFAIRYPGDPAALSPLFLNLFTLEPGQAVFIPAGVLHAYIGGFGVELMAASDNVLRGGLTHKPVDIPGLAKILQFNPFCPEIINPTSEFVFRYPAPCGDFALYLVRGRGEFTTNNTNRMVPGSILTVKGPVICIVTEGECLIEGVVFKKGESFFASGGEPLRFTGNFSLYAACSP